MKNTKSKKPFLKICAIAAIMSTILFSTASQAALISDPVESDPTPTMKGYAPWLKSVGSRFVTVKPADNRKVKVGDVIEVPTYLVDKLYQYEDGIDGKDGDTDNALGDRERAGQYKDQKVSVKWYVVERLKDTDGTLIGPDWADPATVSGADLDADGIGETASGTNQYINDWSEVNATLISEDEYYVAMGNDSKNSLALRVPPQAAGKRIGFIIVPESATGDPYRGAPLKVADLNYLWEQEPVTKPGDIDPDNPECSNISPSDDAAIEACNVNPGTPVEEENNPGNGGGYVQVVDYIVSIRHSESGDGVYNSNDPIVDGTDSRHPYPVVDEVYYADIKVLNKSGKDKFENGTLKAGETLTSADYRILTPAEQKTIVWHMNSTKVDENDAPIPDEPGKQKEFTVAWTGTDDSRMFAVNDPAHPSGHYIRTQLNNSEAVSYHGTDISALQELSEQRMRLKVSFKYDPEISAP